MIIKKAAQPVVHNGIINEGEYEAIPIGRTDGDGESDLLIAWHSSQTYSDALTVMESVNYYVSWDETNGVNFAVSGILPEVPHNETPQPADNAYYEESKDAYFPGDGFIFQYGSMVRVRANTGTAEEPHFESIINRGFSKNTATDALLYGWYWEHGYDNYLLQHPQVAGQDYNVSYNLETHEVVLEISYPFAAVSALSAGGAMTWKKRR